MCFYETAKQNYTLQITENFRFQKKVILGKTNRLIGISDENQLEQT